MQQIKIYLEFSDELQDVLNDNAISIEDILEQEEIDADVTYGVMPAQAEEGARSKDVVSMILANPESIAAIVLSASVAISNIINALNRRPHVVKYDKLTVVRDTDGKVLTDKDGNPHILREEQSKLLEPRATDSKQNLGIEYKDGLVIGFGLSEKQLNTPDEATQTSS